ncbi:hypothetical protein C5B96_10665 [Subtercola sp. Z020]|uniref:hypothetical protein n=1 Tax=Subtercola sp. Z020 TaxID=2080582 RepID=UPI000CE81494|nr:hypothetical protein [Subtercola sp. Z020]PPF80741.1 hypothetical protein C5B96_10665 [Subtercola sp. Z020]
MDSSTLVEGSSGGPPSTVAPRRPVIDTPPAGAAGTPAGRWARRHLASICWFVPLLVVSIGVEVVIVQARVGVNDASVFTGAPSAIFFASLSAVLLWMLARRLRFSRPIAAAMLLLFLFSPISLVVHTTPALQNLAVPLLLAGAIVALRRPVNRRLRMIALAAIGVVLVLAVVFPLVSAGNGSSEPALARWWNLDPALLILGTGCSAAALALKQLRPFGAVSLVFILLALRPGADLPSSSVVVWLPLAVLLVAGVVQEAVQSAFDSDFTALWQEIAAGVLLVATVGVFIFAAPALAPGYRSLLPGAPLGAPGGSADPAAAAGAAPGAGAQPTTAADPSAGASAGTAPAAAAAAPVLTPVPSASVDPAAAAESASAGQSAARASAGAELSRNPALSLTVGAAAELRAGDVDVRSILSLGQLLASTDVAVADFPALDAETGEPRRQILISSVDGTDASGDERIRKEIAAYFLGLNAPLAGASVVGTDEGVLVIFPFGEPVELLPATGGG